MAGRPKIRRIVMHQINSKRMTYFCTLVAALSVVLTFTMPAVSGEYAALEGVKSIKTVFDVTHGSPRTANLVFWAVNNVNDDGSVRALSQPPQVAVVFHGPSVKMISTDQSGFKNVDHEELDKFAKTIRRMKASGVKFEVCDYALKVMGVDPKTVLPEVDHVPNGFISIAGYQAQGYSVITIN
jgi:intracellular sulfur oxidation DsrE/DsrF family protein